MLLNHSYVIEVFLNCLLSDSHFPSAPLGNAFQSASYVKIVKINLVEPLKRYKQDLSQIATSS